VNDVHKLPGADIEFDHNLLVAKVCTSLKEIIGFQKSRLRWDLEKLYAQIQKVQDTLEEKLVAQMQWKNIKESFLDTIGNLVGKVEKKASKPCFTKK
jgi:hypothetical protein